MPKPQLYLFVGYPGAGKTTVAQLIKRETGAVHIWADQERLKMFTDPTHSHAESEQLYKHLNEETRALLTAGKSVIFDTNFNFHKDRQYLSKIAQGARAEATTIWITTPKEVAKQRAIAESDNKVTRLFGNMAGEDFERIASHLQPPAENEKVIKIDGTDLDEALAKRLLKL